MGWAVDGALLIGHAPTPPLADRPVITLLLHTGLLERWGLGFELVLALPPLPAVLRRWPDVAEHFLIALRPPGAPGPVM